MPSKLYCRVETFKLSNDDSIAEKIIDFNNAEDKNWFERNLYWAICNNCGVEITSVMQIDPSKRRLPPD